MVISYGCSPLLLKINGPALKCVALLVGECADDVCGEKQACWWFVTENPSSLDAYKPSGSAGRGKPSEEVKVVSASLLSS